MSTVASPTPRRLAPLAAAALLAAASVLAATPSDARLGGGFSSGSRGMRTFSTPAPTNVAPRVAPLDRSQTAAPFGNGYANRYGASRPGFFGGGFGRGLIGGFLGAGLFGLLSGHGLFGGMGGFGLLSLLLQIGLLVLAFRFLSGLFRRQAAFGGPGGLFGGGSAYGGGRSAGAAPQRGQPITIEPADYQAFEQRLIASQAAYSDNNVGALRQLATPEMAGNFAQELAGNSRQGVSNRLADVRLLSGDLSEAWREGSTDYATVAMRFSLIDVTMEQATGRVVAGNAEAPQEVTEVWTFARQAGSGPRGWLLSAIQQV